MTSKKAALGIFLTLAALAAVLWSIDTYIRPGYQCGTESLERANKTREVFLNYEPLFRRRPNNPYAREGFLRDEKTGRRTDVWGIVITVDGEKVDQATLPRKARIPDELEGVPVQIIPSQIVGKAPSFLDAPFGVDGEAHGKLQAIVLKKNSALFRRYPFFEGYTWFIAKGPKASDFGNRIFGIEVYVSETVDPGTLPPEDRIPGCLEDVPVKITVRP